MCNRMQLALEGPATVVFGHGHQDFVLARLEMNGDLVVETEDSERILVAIVERILARENRLAVQVDDDVVAVTDFEKALTRARRLESGAGEYELGAFDASLAHLFARRHGKHRRARAVAVHQNEARVF